MPSCAASPGSARTWCTVGRSLSTPGARCVVACLGERADGHEGDALVPIIQRARFACPDLESVGADQGFAAERVWTAVADRHITAFVPPRRTMLPAEGDAKTDAQRQAQAARERCKTPEGIWAHKRRMADAEGAVGELKNEHGLDRARCRGTGLFHVQLLFGCTAPNLKRLTSHTDAAQGRAAGPATGQIVALDANAAPTHANAVGQARHHGPPAPARALLLAAPTACTIALSLD
jgi:DDE family transposase